MPHYSEWLAEPMGRRRFIRASSHAALGATALLAGAGGLQAVLGPKSVAHAAVSAATSGIKGITLSGLQTDSTGTPFKSLSEMQREIATSKYTFGATHIRLQIQQQTFIGNGTSYNATYAREVYSAINYALNLGLTVIVNCQTEQGPGVARGYLYPNYPEPNDPTNNATSEFWRYMLTSAGGNYRGHPRVICDLFNEPKCGQNGPNWTIWHDAYQGLINYIRNQLGVRLNQLWVDADNYAASFSGCPGLDDPAANLVYSFHHPSSAGGGYPDGWARDFGDWAASHAVVNGEFSQNSDFNWGSPYDVQVYLNYCASLGIGHTLYTVYGDNYFTDTNWLPYGWWGNMINDFWNPGNGWTTYTFRPTWSQNYIMRTGRQLSWTNGLYQGWSRKENSMLAGAAGFNSFASPMAGGSQYRMHVSFQCIWVDDLGSLAAVLGLHGLASRPITWEAMRPQKPNITNLVGLRHGKWYNMDIPSEYLGQVASGFYKGILFGPGPDNNRLYAGHLSYTPGVAIEVLR